MAGSQCEIPTILIVFRSVDLDFVIQQSVKSSKYQSVVCAGYSTVGLYCINHFDSNGQIL